MKKYDVIIAGASFGGLAAASQIKAGKVLLIDQKKIGVGVKSACGTLLHFVEKLKLEKAVLQVHKKIVLHTNKKKLNYFLTQPFCMIDPQKFNQGLFQMGKGAILRARIESFDRRLKVVKTNKGNFKARIFVDASGPERALVHKTKKDNTYLSFGLETTLPYKSEGLHFWYEPKIFPKGVFWLFPQGSTSRFGVGSYQGETNLKPYLDQFLRRFKLKAGVLHGGYFPHYLKEAVIGKTFLVGDSAGQCLPLTGEGIRPAIIFGQRCGRIIDSILKGNVSLAKGLKKYQNMVVSKSRHYKMMYWTQVLSTAIPEKLFYLFAWLGSRKQITAWILNNYLTIVEDE